MQAETPMGAVGPEIIKSKMIQLDAAYGYEPSEGINIFDRPSSSARWLQLAIPSFPTEQLMQSGELLAALAEGAKKRLDSESMGRKHLIHNVAVFPDDYHERRMPGAAYYEDAQAIGISAKLISELSIHPLEQPFTRTSLESGEVLFIGTLRQQGLMIGFEEADHAVFLSEQFGGNLPPAILYSLGPGVTGAIYDAQPHELRFLVNALVFARENQFDPREIELLEQRIRSAREVDPPTSLVDAYEAEGLNFKSLFEAVRSLSYQVLPN